jgi:hypothetical protein
MRSRRDHGHRHAFAACSRPLGRDAAGVPGESHLRRPSVLQHGAHRSVGHHDTLVEVAQVAFGLSVEGEVEGARCVRPVICATLA